MSRYYDIDYKKLIVMLLPTFWRKPTIYALLNYLLRGLLQVYDSFLTQRTENIAIVNRTGQVCYLRGLLNDSFDIADRRLSINEGQTNDWVFAPKEEEFPPLGTLEPLWLDKELTYGYEAMTFIPRESSIRESGFDFVILIPLALRGVIDENRIIALVNFYKLASKRYDLQYY